MIETEDPLETKNLNCLFLTHIGTAIRSHIGEESLKISLHPAIIHQFTLVHFIGLPRAKRMKFLPMLTSNSIGPSTSNTMEAS